MLTGDISPRGEKCNKMYDPFYMVKVARKFLSKRAKGRAHDEQEQLIAYLADDLELVAKRRDILEVQLDSALKANEHIKKAKEENDERFMTERDEARAALSERNQEFLELSNSFISEQNLRMDDRELADALGKELEMVIVFCSQLPSHERRRAVLQRWLEERE
jgi:hypothetical protein